MWKKIRKELNLCIDLESGRRLRGSEIKELRRETGLDGKVGDKEAVIFIPATPRSELQKRFNKVVQEAKIGIAIVEVAGTSMKKRLQRSDPFK